MLEGLREASNKTVGMKQTLKAVQGGLALKVFLAGDIDDYISQKIRHECQRHDIDIIMVDSMKELGEACGISVGAATAAILEVLD
ncbi:MAG TPA: ribosomal L7Ae/L30e/S12e/Gadd45 family protein [Clostridia bacterium]|nr:ribosomal L7Ae/L30e/S12e/Gadd45 family protein [Clostridia bacterium]